MPVAAAEDAEVPDPANTLFERLADSDPTASDDDAEGVLPFPAEPDAEGNDFRLPPAGEGEGDEATATGTCKLYVVIMNFSSSSQPLSMRTNAIPRSIRTYATDREKNETGIHYFVLNSAYCPDH